MSSITEIVFGDYMNYEIKNSNTLRNNKILKFDMLLSICDLSNINNYIVSYNDEFYNLINNESIYDIKSKYYIKEILDELETSFKNNDKIRVWSDYNKIDSYLMLLCVCSYAIKYKCDLYVLFADEFNNDCFSPKSIKNNEFNKYEHKLTMQEIKKYSNEWQKIVNDNSNLRIIKENEVVSVSFDYYDSIILKKLQECGEIKTVKFVAILLQSIYLYDTVLIYLVDRLIRQGKVIYVNKEEKLWNSIIKINDLPLKR